MLLRRDSSQQGEVRSRPITVGGVPRHDLRHGGGLGLPDNTSHRQVPATPESPHPALAGVAGTHVIAGEAGPPRTTQDARSPVAPEVAVDPGERPSQPPGTPDPAGRGEPLMVGCKGPSTRGGTLRLTGPSPTPVLGCVPGGLGSAPPRPVSIGGVVPSGELSPHQPARDESPVPHPPVIQKPGHRPPSD